MEIKRLYENSTYIGKRIEYSNGDKEWRDAKGNKAGSYNKITDTYRDKDNKIIKNR